MENYCKIITLVFFVLSCNSKNTKQINSDFSNVKYEYDVYKHMNYIGDIYQQNDSIFFSIKCIYCDNHNQIISFQQAQIDSFEFVDLALIVDVQSFRLLGIKNEEKAQIRNKYYLGGRMNAYYIDSKNIYAFVDKDIPEFRLLGSTNDLKIWGGDYIQVKSKIYSGGKLMKDIDLATFKTMDLFPNAKTEWQYTIALDKNNVYFNDKKLSKDDFIRIFGNNQEIEAKYFK